ncbi:GNAT family N-acetyltransferase [Rubrivivax sp. JA1024]|nr:GNAT family N-acetyltransferase [Rubrivivax sp. JA1024]
MVKAAAWRGMTPADLAAVNAIAAVVHAAYPEDAAVFAERLALHPGGCFVLDTADGLGGYLISHPWHLSQPPALNALLGSVPQPASTYYLHDIALLPEARGGGAASAVIRELVRHAEGIADNITLVALSGTVQFWQRQGFARLADPALDAKLKSYDAEACYMQRRL